MKRELKMRRAPREDRWVRNVIPWLNRMAGEETVESVERCLGWGAPNEERSTLMASFKRIIRLIEALNSAQASIEAAPLADEEERANVPLSALNNLLARYPSSPVFYIESGRGWAIEEAFRGPGEADEWLAAHGILELTKLNKLSRLRSCICGRWLFARRDDQQFCSDACRHWKYEHSWTPERKEQRQKYLRAYYKLKTSGRVK